MKCLCDRKELLAAYSLAASVVPARTTSEIVKSILMTADESGASLVATNFEVFIRLPVHGCEVQEPGRVLLDGKRIGQAVANYDDDVVRVEKDGSKVIVGEDGAAIKLPTEDPAKFPAMPEWPTGPTWKIKASDLALLAGRTTFAADEGLSRYALAGCLVLFGEDTLGLVATDGRKLATMSVPGIGGVSEIRAPIPPAVFGVAVKMFGGDDVVEVGFSGPNALEPSRVHLRSETNQGAAVVGSIVAGRYPRWESVIPEPDQIRARATVPVEPLRKAIRAASAVTSEDTRGIRLAFSRDAVEVAGRTVGLGESSKTVGIESDLVDPVSYYLESRDLKEGVDRAGDVESLEVAIAGQGETVTFSLLDGWKFALHPLTLDDPKTDPAVRAKYGHA